MNRRPTLLWQTPLGPRSRGAWNRVSIPVSGLGEATLLYVTLHDEQGEAMADTLYLNTLGTAPPAVGQAFVHLCFVPPTVTQARLFAVGATARAVRAAAPDFRPLSRARASLRLLWHTPPAAWAALPRAAGWRPAALLRGARQLLAATNAAAYTPPQDYASWIALFDSWAPEDFAAREAGAAARPSLAYLVLAHDPAGDALAATLRSIARQQGGAPPHGVLGPAGLAPALAAMAPQAGYIGILQAGEVLPPHATRLAADQLARLGLPEIAITDDDDIALDATRQAPRFRPTPSPVTMLSGILARGLWLVRRETLLRHAPPAPAGAEALRLDTWLARHRAGAAPFSARIPFILSHRRPDTEATPPAALAAIAARHLQHAGPAIVPAATWPLTFGIRPGHGSGPVTAIVPSTLRQPHSLACIRAILEGTDHPQFTVHVAVMQPGPLDATQQAAAAALRQYPNATVSHLAAPHFNFSTVNNHVAARTGGEYILLLNDDVSPIRRDWLRWMTAFMADPGIGIVGARLLYPAGPVQHGGVIMGLSGLCDHAHRGLPGAEPGYMARAILAQEMSVVTGACLLVRRALYEQVGGLDEGYPSAFNDVDFALRVGETGHAVLYAAQAELHHHELQTYGSHYAGERQAFRDAEVLRMRQRWAAVCAADPFHNPNLGLAPGGEWKLAFSPRVLGPQG